MNPYTILGVPRDATEEEIKNAYRKKAKEMHPDRNEGCDEAFKRITSAYNILKNADKRLEYDTTGRTNSAPSKEEQADLVLAQMWLDLLEKHQFQRRNYFDILHINLNKICNGLEMSIKAIKRNVKGMEYHVQNVDTSDSFNNIVQARLHMLKGELADAERQLEMYSFCRDRVIEFDYTGETPSAMVAPWVQDSPRGAKPSFWGV